MKGFKLKPLKSTYEYRVSNSKLKRILTGLETKNVKEYLNLMFLLVFFYY